MQLWTIIYLIIQHFVRILLGTFVLRFSKPPFPLLVLQQFFLLTCNMLAGQQCLAAAEASFVCWLAGWPAAVSVLACCSREKQTCVAWGRGGRGKLHAVERGRSCVCWCDVGMLGWKKQSGKFEIMRGVHWKKPFSNWMAARYGQAFAFTAK